MMTGHPLFLANDGHELIHLIVRGQLLQTAEGTDKVAVPGSLAFVDATK
jgi:hypothetical protein